MNNLYIKYTLLLCFVCFFLVPLSAQNIIIPDGITDINVQGGESFYDGGGIDNDYTSDEDRTITFRVPAGAFIRVVFNQFDLEDHRNCNWDWLKIFDGGNNRASEFGTYCGTNSPGTITSTGNSLTFQFHSDGSVENSGWEAQIEVLMTIDLAKSFDRSCEGIGDGLIQFYETTPSIDSNLEFSIDAGNTWQSSPVFTALSEGNYNLQIRLGGGGSVSPNYSLSIGTYSALTVSSSVTDENCGVSDGSIDLTVGGGRSGSLVTNGATGVVDLQSSFMSNLSSFTMEGWVKLGAARSTYTGQKSFFGQNDAIEFGFENGKFACWTAGGGRVDYSISNYPDDQKWHHVAVVGTGTNLILYIDGNEVSRSSRSTGNYGSNSSYTAKIGAGVWDPGLTSEPFNGVFSHVRFWNTDRSQAQIDNWKDQSVLGDETNLMAVYKLNTPPDGNKIYGIGSKGTVAIMNSGATWSDVDPVYSYAWTGPGGFTSSDEDITDLIGGIYNLTSTDLNGCSLNKDIEVGVNDTQAPVADVANLSDVTVGECNGTPSIPTATDRCSGKINGTPDVAFPIINQGTTVVMWTYDDGNGNISTQNQNVIVKDDTKPVISCQADIEHVLYCNLTSVQINVPTPTDNCSLQSLTYRIGSGAESTNLLSNVGSTTIINMVTAGDYIITWTATDINGNTSSCNFNIHVDTEPVINALTKVNTSCETANDGQIIVKDITVEFGTAEYSIDGSNWQLANMFSGLSAGNYDVKIRTEIDGQYCESIAKSVSVDSPTAITISKSNLVDATCAANADGEIEISVMGGDQALHFDGVNSYVALDLNYKSPTAISKMTVAAWVKVGPSTGDGGWAILDFDRSEYFNFTIAGMNSQADYHVSFNTRSPSGNIHDFNSIATIDDDQWHFVVGVYDGTDKYIFIDGKLDSSTTNPHSGSALGSSKRRYAFIGTGSEAGTYNGSRNSGYIFEGGIADVWYFESSITDLGDLNNLSNGTVPGGHIPKGHWRLNEIDNTFVSNLADPNSYGEMFGMDASNISTANVYTFSCTKNGISYSLDGIISEVTTNNYKLANLPVGEYILTATDNKGCSNNTSFTISNGDVLPPVKPTLNDITSECSATAIAPTTTDACSGTITGTTTAPLTYTTQGTHVIVWTFDDGNGNSTTANQNVIIKDITKPTITAPTDVSENLNTGSCTVSSVVLGTPSTNDNCGVASVSNNAPLTYPLGMTTVTWTVTDNSGLTSTDTQIVTIIDNIDPVINNIPTDILITNCMQVVNWVEPTATDNCISPTLVSNHNSGQVFPVGETIVTYTADDGTNTVQKSFKVTVQDGGMAPLICFESTNHALSKTTVQSSVGYGGIASRAVDGNTNGVWGNNSVTHTNRDVNAWWQVDLGVEEVVEYVNVFRRTDCCTDRLVNFYVMLSNHDLQNVTLGNALVDPNVESYYVAGNPGNLKRILTSGNTARYVKIQLSGQNYLSLAEVEVMGCVSQNGNDITADAEGGTCSAQVTWDLPTSIDNCGIVTLTSNHNSGNDFPVGTTTVTYTATDGSNVANSSFDVIVSDKQNPTILNCPTDFTVSGCGNIATWTAPTASDNCSATLSSTHNSGDIFPVGTTIVTYTATDEAGNITEESFIVTVNATPKPIGVFFE